jgi:hypothetical protein
MIKSIVIRIKKRTKYILKRKYNKDLRFTDFFRKKFSNKLNEKSKYSF